MYLNSFYFGLKVVCYVGTMGPKYILFEYMDPQGYINPKATLKPES